MNESTANRFLRFGLFLFGGTVAVTFIVYGLFPDARTSLVVEEGFVENLTTLLFAVAFAVGLVLCIKSRVFRKTQAVIAATGLLGVLDELSFGERILGVEMPRLFGFKVDGAHDFFYLLAYWIHSMPRLYAGGIILICMGISAWTGWKYGGRLMNKILRTYGRPIVELVMFFCLFLLVALVIDLGIIQSEILFVLEEQLEMNAAIALIIISLGLYFSGHPVQDVT